MIDTRELMSRLLGMTGTLQQGRDVIQVIATEL